MIPYYSSRYFLKAFEYRNPELSGARSLEASAAQLFSKIGPKPIFLSLSSVDRFTPMLTSPTESAACSRSMHHSFPPVWTLSARCSVANRYSVTDFSSIGRKYPAYW